MIKGWARDMAAFEVVLPIASWLGEGAVWDVAARALWWVDIKGRLIHRFDPASNANKSWPAPYDVGSLTLRASGGLVVAMARGFYAFDPATGSFTSLAEPEAKMPENRFNDGKPDRQGRFWAGTLHDPETRPIGSLYRLDADLSWHRLVEGITASNALAFSPDGRTLYYGDSAQRTVWAWDLDPDDGSIRNRRVFISLGPGEGAPDGAAVDAEGCYWLTRPSAWTVARYDARGRRDRVIELPVQNPTCVAFGGADLRTLYCTTCRWGLSEAEQRAQPMAGHLFAIRVDVPGLQDAAFVG
jgi:sugar lactone lactonase YvrE